MLSNLRLRVMMASHGQECNCRVPSLARCTLSLFPKTTGARVAPLPCSTGSVHGAKKGSNSRTATLQCLSSHQQATSVEHAELDMPQRSGRRGLLLAALALSCLEPLQVGAEEAKTLPKSELPRAATVSSPAPPPIVLVVWLTSASILQTT